MRILTMFITLVAMQMFFCTQSLGQELSKLRDKAKQVVEKKQPDWKLVGKQEGEKETWYSWKSGREGASILIFYGNSKEEAKERMDHTSRRLSIGPGKPRDDLGDEAYFWKNEHSGSMSIRFRKGKVYIEIAAPSAEMAEELAKELEKFIKK